MKLMAVRRAQMANTGKSDIPLPLPAPPTPEHAPNAALHAIKKHAEKFVAFKARAVRKILVTRSILGQSSFYQHSSLSA